MFDCGRLFLFLVIAIFCFSSCTSSNSSNYYDKVAALNFDKQYNLGIFKDDLETNATDSNEMMRQCSCSEYDKCVDIAFDSVRISNCETHCIKLLNVPGLNYDKYLQVLKRNKAYAYVVHNCFNINDQSYCSQNSSTFIPKKYEIFNFEAKLQMFLLRNDITINKNPQISFEEWQFHECSGECLLNLVKHCIKLKNCDITFPEYSIEGCVVAETPKIQHGFHPPPSFIKGRIHFLENVPVIPNKMFYDFIARYPKREKERLTTNVF